MSDLEPAPAAPDPWAALRDLTPARIGLGRVGTAPPLESVLELRTAHAAARDAVWTPPDWAGIEAALTALGIAWVPASSQVPDRATYLLRPDLGRVLDEESRASLAGSRAEYDLVIVCADGLSGEALTAHALTFLRALRPKLTESAWRVAPVVLAQQGRVALGDEVGAAIGARLALVVIGERPGLSAADSLGLYLTYDPRPGRLDSERNCISNVRPGGLPPAEAARLAMDYLAAARQQSLTGTRLRVEALGHEPDALP